MSIAQERNRVASSPVFKVMVSHLKNVSVDGVVYANVKLASDATGLTIKVIRHRVLDPRFTSIFYTDAGLMSYKKVPDNTERVHSKETREKVRLAAIKREAGRHRNVSIDGVVYDNMSVASRAINVHVDTLRKRVKSRYFTTYFMVDKT